MEARDYLTDEPADSVVNNIANVLRHPFHRIRIMKLGDGMIKASNEQEHRLDANTAQLAMRAKMIKH